MAYPQIEDKNILGDVNSRKEFVMFMKSVAKIPAREDWYNIKGFISGARFLRFRSSQLALGAFVNPNTNINRILVKWSTGVGKTLGATAIALEFIPYMRRRELAGVSDPGSVFILGFSEHTFKNQLLQFPELGFITDQEMGEIDKLKKLISSGMTHEKDKLRELSIKIKKRFSNRKGNGFFKFIGYKALVNKLFITSISIKLYALSKNEIEEKIKTGEITINHEFLNLFKNSTVICDEIHNVYNSAEKNNWGTALQYILDNIPSVNAALMSATPLNNNPEEIIDLLSILTGKKLIKSNLFLDRKLKPGALEKIKDLCRGRISFLRDDNPKYFPSRSLVGETIPNIDYLKFIRCPMSPGHYATYKKVYTGTLPPDGQYLVDFALPNPESKTGPNPKNQDDRLYQTQTIKKMLTSANPKWKREKGLDFINGRIVGDALKLENLYDISSKYHTIMSDLLKCIKDKTGKFLIFHPVVQMSGVLFMEQVLLKNGVIGEFGGSSSSTLCICGKPRDAHTSKDGGARGKQLIKGKEGIRYVETTHAVKIISDVDGVLICEFQIDPDAVHIHVGDINIDAMPVGKIFDLVRKHNKLDMGKRLADSAHNVSGKPIVIETLPESIDLHNALEKIKFKPISYGKYIYYTDIEIAQNESEKDLTKALLKRVSRGGKPDKTGNIIDANKEHEFTPVRYAIIHSDIDRTSLLRSLEKYNRPSNSRGAEVMILVGAKIIKEAYNLFDVTQEWIIGRPDNISSLKQVFGRGNRNGSHRNLPPSMRHIEYRIYTTCLPNKKLSYEEEKYMLKMDDYKIIQQIEKVFHEVAYDSAINYELINREDVLSKSKGSSKSKGPSDPLRTFDILPFKPEYTPADINLDKLQMSTFNVYFAEKEVNYIVYIIKRLFIQVSPVWTRDKLWEAVRSPPFDVEFKSSIFDECSFIIALHKLTYVKSSDSIEPLIFREQSTVRSLFDPEDKLIFMGEYYIICQVDNYYILFKVDPSTKEPIIDMEGYLNHDLIGADQSINIRGFLEGSAGLFDYTEKKHRFHDKWANISIENLEDAVCDFGTDFHVQFLEECIEYVFSIWTEVGSKKSQYHEFYFKMLYYYNLRSLIIWAHTSKEMVAKSYEKYVTPINISILDKSDMLVDFKKETSGEAKLSTSGVINLLKSSINTTLLNWAPSEAKAHFKNNLELSLALFSGKFKKSKKPQKVSADLLPVGHFFRKIPRFYHPEKEGGWYDLPEYIKPSEHYKENDLIIGYDEKTETGVHIRFKIRPPAHKAKKFKDVRKMEKGSVCAHSKSKTFLKEIANKLGITPKDKINVESLCDRIRTKLIYNELKERIKKTKIKWFYFSYEYQP